MGQVLGMPSVTRSDKIQAFRSWILGQHVNNLMKRGTAEGRKGCKEKIKQWRQAGAGLETEQNGSFPRRRPH